MAGSGDPVASFHRPDTAQGGGSRWATTAEPAAGKAVLFASLCPGLLVLCSAKMMMLENDLEITSQILENDNLQSLNFQ